MRRSGALARRSGVEWTVRIALAAMAAGLAYQGVTFSAAQAIASADTALAHRLAPYDGRISARLAGLLSTGEAADADRQRADSLARLALRQNPMAVIAVSALAVNTELRGDTQGARRLFDHAERLSRRDLQTQLWKIEDAVGRGDVRGALRHYDIALRTHPGFWELLYPVLGAAASDRVIRAELLRTLRGRPAWGESFVTYLAGSGPDPAAASALFLAMRGAGLPVAQEAHAITVDRLIRAGQTDAAWRYYAAIRPGAERVRSRDPRFTLASPTPSQFDWVAVNDGVVSGSFQRGNRGGVFDFAASTGNGGAMLRQVQLLPPGRYRLTGRSTGVDQLTGSPPYWSLSCGEGRELGRVMLANSGSGVFEGVFEVPAGCPVQTLALIAQPSDAVGGVSGQIERAALAPIS
jgi:hypothetical protein